MEPWWNLTSGLPRTTPEPIWAETPKLSAVGEKLKEKEGKSAATQNNREALQVQRGSSHFASGEKNEKGGEILGNQGQGPEGLKGGFASGRAVGTVHSSRVPRGFHKGSGRVGCCWGYRLSLFWFPALKKRPAFWLVSLCPGASARRCVERREELGAGSPIG